MRAQRGELRILLRGWILPLDQRHGQLRPAGFGLPTRGESRDGSQAITDPDWRSEAIGDLLDEAKDWGPLATAFVPRIEAENVLGRVNDMSSAIEKLQTAMTRANAVRPRVGGFPYLAEVLRQAGVTRNLWSLPACQSVYLMEDGAVVTQGTPLVSGTVDVPPFDQDALIAALRTDQAGNSTFPEFLAAAWRAGVVRYDVDFAQRVVTYYGIAGAAYAEHYPAVGVG